MQKIAMLGSGFIGRFYTDSLHGYRNKDRVISVYSRSEESVKKFAQDYKVPHFTNNMEESVSNKDVDVVCIALPNYLHEKARYVVNIISSSLYKPLRMPKKQKGCLKQ